MLLPVASTGDRPGLLLYPSGKSTQVLISMNDWRVDQPSHRAPSTFPTGWSLAHGQDEVFRSDWLFLAGDRLCRFWRQPE